MAAVIFWIAVIGALLSYFFKPDGVQVKPTTAGDSSLWVCKDCNELFNSPSRDAKCSTCGSNNVWPYEAKK